MGGSFLKETDLGSFATCGVHWLSLPIGECRMGNAMNCAVPRREQETSSWVLSSEMILLKLANDQREPRFLPLDHPANHLHVKIIHQVYTASSRITDLTTYHGSLNSLKPKEQVAQEARPRHVSSYC